MLLLILLLLLPLVVVVAEYVKLLCQLCDIMVVTMESCKNQCQGHALLLVFSLQLVALAAKAVS